ncbi:MAG: 3-methyladenine glycosylase/8-oxoguanine glycosylase, partial [Modestobacter sp.]|nr:3-methyladenine glycosylase/8-oxoguanine glycosylase [Modestobacter sp.]
MSGTLAAPEVTSVWRPDWPLDPRRTLSRDRRGVGDPTLQYTESGIWRTTTTPEGPATVRLWGSGAELHVAAWGPGAAWAGAAVPGWLGAEDSPAGFPVGEHPLVDRLHRSTPWLRLGRTGRTWDVLVPAVLEQKVTGIEAHRTWRELVRLAGEPAPGPAPAGMRVVPSAERVLAVTDGQGHACGLDGARRRALRAVASVASRLEATDHQDCADLRRR